VRASRGSRRPAAPTRAERKKKNSCLLKTDKKTSCAAARRRAADARKKTIEGEKKKEKEKPAAPLGGDALRALAARTRVVSSKSRFHCSTCVIGAHISASAQYT